MKGSTKGTPGNFAVVRRQPEDVNTAKLGKQCSGGKMFRLPGDFRQKV
jgi:hypothetical protein